MKGLVDFKQIREGEIILSDATKDEIAIWILISSIIL